MGFQEGGVRGSEGSSPAQAREERIKYNKGVKNLRNGQELERLQRQKP